MIEPQQYSISTYLWVLWFSIWGASVAYLQRIKTSGIRAFRVFVFVVDNLTATLIGFLTFFLCDYRGVDWRITIAAVAIMAHQGTRGLFLLRNRLLRVAVEDQPRDDGGGED